MFQSFPHQISSTMYNYNIRIIKSYIFICSNNRSAMYLSNHVKCLTVAIQSLFGYYDNANSMTSNMLSWVSSTSPAVLRPRRR